MTDFSKMDPTELAKRVRNSMDRDLGYHKAFWFGQDPFKMTDEELMAWGRLPLVAKEPECCPECGQELPD